ncbi:MAG: PAS domain S-box-containing protein, partial [Verrucomicrobiales bacterium]
LRYRIVNEAAARMLKTDRNLMLDQRIDSVFPEIVDSPFFKAIKAVQGGEQLVEREEFFPPLERWYESRFYPAPDGGVSILFQDTTEHHRNERRLAMALASGRMGVWEHDFGTNLTAFDDRLAEMWGVDLGLRMDEIAWKNIVHPEDWDDVSRVFIEAIESGTDYEHEYRIKKGSQNRWMHSMASISRGSNQAPLSAIGVSTDVTERKRAENRLRDLASDLERRVEERASQLKLVAENVPGFLSLVDRDLCFRFANRAYEKAYGLSSEEIIGRPVAEVLGAENWARVEGRLRATLAGEQQNYEITLVTPATGESTVRATLTPSRDRSGEVTGVLVLGIDISEERRLQQEVLTAAENEKERLGRDLHDTVCQDLTGISLVAKALEEQLKKEKSPAAAAAELLVKQLDVSTNTARQLARGASPISLEERSLRRAITDLLEETSVIHHKVRLNSDLRIRTRDLDPAFATELFYIVREALFNALKHGTPQRVDIELWWEDGDVCLSVTDDGSGILETALNDGSGQGLRSMKHRAQQLLGGQLKIECNPAGAGLKLFCRATAPPRKRKASSLRSSQLHKK